MATSEVNLHTAGPQQSVATSSEIRLAEKLTNEVSKAADRPAVSFSDISEPSTQTIKKVPATLPDGVVSILKKPAECSPSFVRLMFDHQSLDDSIDKRSVTIGDEEVVMIDFPDRNFDFSTEDDFGDADIDQDADDTDEGKPDGGYGWVITAAAFFVNVIIIGTHNVFGLLFLDLTKDFKQSLFKTSLIGSIAFGCILVFGPVGGVLSNKYGCRKVALCGVVISALCLLCSSFATSIEFLFLSYGVGFGFGTSLAYMQGIVMVSRYFSRRRAMATGLVFCGSAVGTLVMSPIYSILVLHIGWRRTLRIISLIISTTLLCCMTYRPIETSLTRELTIEERVNKSPARRFILDMSLWKNKAFIVWAIAVGLCKIGYLVPYIHLVKHVEDLGGSREYGSTLLSVIGISSGVSRVLFGRIADSPKVNRLYMSQASAFSMGIANLLLPSFSSENGALIYVIVVGLMDGGMEILLPVMTLDLVGNENMTIAWGCLLAVISCSAAGPPIAGAIRDIQGEYSGAFYFAGAPMVLSAFTLILIPAWAQKQTQQPATSFLSIDPSKLELETFTESKSEVPKTTAGAVKKTVPSKSRKIMKFPFKKNLQER